MLIRSSPLPKGNFRKVWDALTTQLKSPATPTTLNKFVKLWQLQEASDTDSIYPADWLPDHFPALRLELVGGPAEWFNQVTTRTMVAVNLTLGLQSVDVRDMTDYWEVVVAQLFNGSGQFYANMKPLGVMSYSVTNPAFKTMRFADQSSGQVATGSIVFNYEFRTKI